MTPHQQWLQRKHREYLEALQMSEDEHTTKQLLNEVEKIEQLMKEEAAHG